ncbi:hypothetical protein ciss_09070 [Carboxydothermus islandicus]|uniref:tRNA (guanine-N(1)-)-methyltransferase C-terminal domain-containing protein n=1 Tax=Carboxydothermus islandicus TaxID=661089 RepID=A0A1L8D1G6_9THEO|nr:RNA methyltransferase [Carboxydothermus islandicus]GAV24974.1 hypothetical protein ciss_09070 [Carboxydothermus islandicus]
MGNVYLALVHHPVYNKHLEVVTTSVTNLDIHDIARSSRTYGIKNYYIVHPSSTMKQLINKVLNFWQEGYGASYNPDRKEAFRIVKLVDCLEDVVLDIEKIEGKKPLTVSTDARVYPNTVSYNFLRKKIKEDENPYLLLFGTGWGLTREVMESTTYILEPIYGPTDYNHLSVRSAVAIILDRLLGEEWFCKSKLLS